MDERQFLIERWNMRDTDYLCPGTAFKKKCKALRASCPKWIMIVGHNPNTGESINDFDCADKWVPTLLVEIAMRANQTSAEVSKLRSIVDKGMPEMIENEEEINPSPSQLQIHP